MLQASLVEGGHKEMPRFFHFGSLSVELSGLPVPDAKLECSMISIGFTSLCMPNKRLAKRTESMLTNRTPFA